jgi:hypothetical protein
MEMESFKVEGAVEPAGVKVAVLVDFSLNARACMERALAVAKEKSGGELVLVHCMKGDVASGLLFVTSGNPDVAC